MKEFRLIFLCLLFPLSFSKAQSVPPGSDFVSFDCGIQQDKERLDKKFFASTPAIFLRANNDEFTYGTLQLGKRKKQIFMYLQIMADNVCIKKDRNVDIFFESGEIISLQNEYPLNCDGFFVRQLKKNEWEKLKNNKITLIKIYTYNIDTIKDYMERAYSRWDDLDGETKEYKRLGRGYTVSKSLPPNAYDSFSDLVFGFAPKGMVVVWLRFGNTQIELGRYQAEVVKNDKKLEEKLFASWSMNRKEVREEYLNPNVSPLEWDNYRIRYNWRPVVTSTNPKFRLFEILNYTYNGEKEGALRPWVLNMPYKERAIPKEMVFTWETGKEKQEQKNARAFFNWEKTNEAFKKAGNKIDMQVKIADDNNSIEILLNGKPLETDSIRIYQWSGDYKESYK